MVSNESIPVLSVVIPTLGRRSLIRTIRSLAEMTDFKDVEVLVIGQIQDQDTLLFLRGTAADYPQIRHVAAGFVTGDLSKKKNLGLSESRSAIVAFIDDDLTVPAEWAREIVRPFEDKSVAMVCGPSLLPPDLPLMARLAGLALSSKAAGFVARRYTLTGTGPARAGWEEMIGCNMACRKDIIREIGGFNTGLIPGEDMLAASEMSKRGYVLVSNPAARVFHYPRQTLRGFCRQAYRFGRARIRMLKYGMHIAPVTWLPALWLGSLPVLIAMSAIWWPAIFLLAAHVAAYAFFCLLTTATTFAGTRKTRDMLLLPLIPVMHACYGFGQWSELFSPGRNLAERRVSSEDANMEKPENL